ncbi:MAG: YqiA/YcfP family alpha/beta fold hydrolase [Oleiphilaceae bacterium]|nr:YqiA/YcfP family alpha/beta fold hydrolase [Oleiphilaceae bacterium]
MAPDIVYLHGFRSSPASEKARQLAFWASESGYSGQVHIPQLGFEPEPVVAQIRTLIETLLAQGREVALIGSSLGGFLAALMAERYGLRAALINPAPRPYDLFREMTGEHENLYTGERFVVTTDHLESLRAMDGPLSVPERLLVLLQTGDETLDYRQALARYQGAHCHVQEGGDHSYVGFEQKLPAIMAFLSGGDWENAPGPC